ncbi:MAG TPA: efflux RND transporter periplasmic adaptor subunit [Methylomirabilota bacterium]|nr:efflux RND transporter periplasmic adaptor subunit [Methylomirabilota bacterium]
MEQQQLEKLRIRSESKRRRHGAPWLIFGVVLLATAAAIYFGWSRGDEQRIVGRAPTNAVAASPANSSNSSAPGSATDAVLTVSGYIVNRERIEISPRFLGVVKWIGVKKGDAVTNGQIVVLLDDAEQKARLSEAQAQLVNAKVAVEKAEIDYGRVRQLIEQNIETKQFEDDSRLRVAASKASLQQAEAAVVLVRTYLDWTIIRSPISGVVLEKLVDQGELVTPQSFGGGRGPSTAVLAVADPKDLQVEIDLNETDVAKVSLNQECRVSPEAYPDKSYRGYVAEKAPEANRQKGTLQVKVQIRDPDKFLTPELSAKVEFLKP